ncbi:MAG: hypothetical protein KAW17_05430 [Candidatus Eisenbacteria sp.]|nr:hypothetical protein [Candidatus Eisenbacteria bacterium]
MNPECGPVDRGEGARRSPSGGGNGVLDKVFPRVIRILPFVLFVIASGIVPQVARAGLANTGDVVVSARLEPESVYLDQDAVLEIVVVYAGDGRTLALSNLNLPSLDGVRVRNRSATTETLWDPDLVRTRVQHRLTLAPVKAGTVALDSIRVDWVDLESGEQRTQVVSAGELRVRERPPVIGTLIRHPRRSLAGGVLLVLGIGVLAWLFKRKRPLEADPDVSPEEVLERNWRGLRALAGRGSLGPFSEEASRSIREYLRERYGIPAAHLPTAAIVESLKAANVSSRVVASVQGTLSFVDDMKFGLWVPTHQELERIVGEIEQLWSSGRRGEGARARGSGT